VGGGGCGAALLVCGRRRCPISRWPVNLTATALRALQRAWGRFPGNGASRGGCPGLPGGEAARFFKWVHDRRSLLTFSDLQAESFLRPLVAAAVRTLRPPRSPSRTEAHGRRLRTSLLADRCAYGLRRRKGRGLAKSAVFRGRPPRHEPYRFEIIFQSPMTTPSRRGSRTRYPARDLFEAVLPLPAASHTVTRMGPWRSMGGQGVHFPGFLHRAGPWIALAGQGDGLGRVMRHPALPPVFV